MCSVQNHLYTWETSLCETRRHGLLSGEWEGDRIMGGKKGRQGLCFCSVGYSQTVNDSNCDPKKKGFPRLAAWGIQWLLGVQVSLLYKWVMEHAFCLSMSFHMAQLYFLETKWELTTRPCFSGQLHRRNLGTRLGPCVRCLFTPTSLRCPAGLCQAQPHSGSLTPMACWLAA